MARLAIVGNDGKPKKDRFTLYTDPDFAEEIRNAVTALGMPFSEVASAALRAHLDHLRKTENRGKPWPQRRRTRLITSRPK